MKKSSILGILAALSLSSCAYLSQHQNEIKSAVSTGATILVASAKTYQAIGEPGMPTQYTKLFNGLCSGADQLQTQLGQPANLTVINTGSPAVNAALVKNITPGATVTQGDVNAVYAAANSLVQPASVSPNAK